MRSGRQIIIAAALIFLSAHLLLRQDAPAQAPSAPEVQPMQKAPDGAAAQEQKSPATKSAADAKTSDTPAGTPKPHGKSHAKHPAYSPSSSSSEPKKVVVRQGGASEPEAQIVTGMTPQEAIIQQQEAEKALDAADENLTRFLGRPLDAQQEETVSQIHNYMGRARSALKEGDISRGHTLAIKANLLAEDLVKY